MKKRKMEEKNQTETTDEENKPKNPKIEQDKDIEEKMGKLFGVYESFENFTLPRTKQVDQVIDKLVKIKTSEREKILFLTGMAGIGKTVICSLTVRNEKVRKHFVDGIYWIQLSKDIDKYNFNLYLISKQNILLRYLSKPDDDDKEVEEGKDKRVNLNRIKTVILNKKILIVIDEVYSRDVLSYFDFCGEDCPNVQILITTSVHGLSISENEIEINELNEKESFEVLDKSLSIKDKEIFPMETFLENENIQMLVSLSHGHILTLQVIGYLINRNISNKKYLESVVSYISKGDFMNRKDLTPIQYSYTVFSMVECCVDKLEKDYKEFFLMLSTITKLGLLEFPLKKLFLNVWILKEKAGFDVLINLSDHCLLKFDDDKITLHPLIAHYLNQKEKEISIKYLISEYLVEFNSNFMQLREKFISESNKQIDEFKSKIKNLKQ